MRSRASIRGISGLVLVLACVGPAFGSVDPAVRRLPPDLRPLPPLNVSGPTTEFMVPLGVDAPLLVDGCFIDERVRKGAQRCLRFDGIVGNYGKGPLELAYSIDGSTAIATQRIFNSDGTFQDRFATKSEFHPTHAHFHVQDFYIARLWESTAQGGKLGKEPVSTGDKNGFCPEDSRPLQDEDTTSGWYSCFTEGERDESAALQIVGISAGWQDIYGYSLPDQYVEITDVPDGYYALELELDPNDVFDEARERNNTVCVVLELKGATAELLDPSITC